MRPASSKCDEHGNKIMPIIVAVDADVRPCMLVDGDRWLNKTRFNAQYEHGLKPVGMQAYVICSII
jgi:hypothetical protein